MLPSSHLAPINAAALDAESDARLLADAFSDFISASSRLESSYRELQLEVAQLSRELEQRNLALSRSLEANEQMRVALQTIVNSMPCGVLVLDGTDRVSMMNDETRRLLGLDSEAIETLAEVAVKSGLRLQWPEAIEEESEREFCLKGRPGERWLVATRRRLPAARGSDITIFVLRDVTAHREAERERETARNAVALAEMSTILAHEIRNPLASLELFAGLVVRDPENADEWVSHLQAGIRSLSGTVNNVLSFHGVAFPHLAPVDLAASLRNAVEFARPIAEQAGISLNFSAEGEEIRVFGNDSGLQQVVLNLVSNAVRHTQAGGSISVAVSAARKGQALVAFCDTGCGMPTEVAGRIFEAGFSALGDTPGLGLAVCRRIARQHGGEIRVQSKLNQGTIFELELPTI